MATKLRCELISWSAVQGLCQRLAVLIKSSGYHPDVVVAIGRGGYVPARLICDCLNIMALTSIKLEHYLAGSSKQEQAIVRYPLCADIENLRVLLVDDVNDSGDTLQLALEHIQSFRPGEVRTAVMHHKIVSTSPVDYHAKKIVHWRWLIYPWAMVEDISGFIQQLDPVPDSVAAARQLLMDQFNIRISEQRLESIFSCVGRE